MMKPSQYIALGMIGGVIVLSVFGIWHYNSRYSKESVPQATSFQQMTENVSGESLLGESFAEKASELPLDLNLEATFYSQAPFADWSFPWQEACEEASVLLAANEYWGHNWTREQFNEEILKLVDWQNERFGTYLDTTVAQTSEILNEYLDLKTLIHEDPTYEDVQKILAKGHFIVMFFAGKQLGNPHYKNGGPLYHAMLIKGYKKGERVIAHDVGTRNGEDYVYKWSTLQHALHDFATPIESGAKRMLEVLPPVAQ